MHTRAILVWKKADGTSVRFEVTDKPLIVGRGEDAGGRIEDEAVSRHHFVITPRDDAFFIEDLNSTNGTWVNDERLVEPRELRVFNRVRAGHALFAFDKEIVPPKKQETPK